MVFLILDLAKERREREKREDGLGGEEREKKQKTQEIISRFGGVARLTKEDIPAKSDAFPSLNRIRFFRRTV